MGPAWSRSSNGVLVLALLSLLVGSVSGLVCAIFRLVLQRADTLRGGLIAWAYGEGVLGLLLVIAGAAGATGLAAALVRWVSPDAGGSGIPEVEAAIRGGKRGRPVRNAIVKFVGGILAIGSGLALGREGPSVQMGHSIADIVARLFQRNERDARVLFAAGAGAGLATAFNAPIAGAVFVLEELLRRFDTRTASAALGASAGAIAVARVLFGEEPDFTVPIQPFPGFATVPEHHCPRHRRRAHGRRIHPCNYRLAGGSGPGEVDPGRGSRGADRRPGRPTGMVRAPAGRRRRRNHAAYADGRWDVVSDFVFTLRFGLGPLSYAAGTPGGLFAPMLVLGAQIGVVFGRLCVEWFPDAAASPTAYAVVGMTAFFTAVVRAPLTGIALGTEMTASANLLLPMLAACFGAMVVTNLIGIPPIYDLLRERAERSTSLAK